MERNATHCVATAQAGERVERCERHGQEHHSQPSGEVFAQRWRHQPKPCEGRAHNDGARRRHVHTLRHYPFVRPPAAQRRNYCQAGAEHHYRIGFPTLPVATSILGLSGRHRQPYYTRLTKWRSRCGTCGAGT